MRIGKGISKKKLLTAGLLILPAAILIIIYYLYPMLTTVYYAFTDMTLTGSTATATNFVGLRNFKSIVTDPKFPEILKNTLVFLLFQELLDNSALDF